MKRNQSSFLHHRSRARSLETHDLPTEIEISLQYRILADSLTGFSTEKRFSTFYAFRTYRRLNGMTILTLDNQLTIAVLTVIPEEGGFSTFWTSYLKW
jgi:hypothetical protein